MTIVGLIVFFLTVIAVFVPVYKSVEKLDKRMTPYYNFELYLPEANQWSAFFFVGCLITIGLAVAFFVKIDIASISL